MTPPTPPIFDGRAEARLIALACSTPPEGRSSWTMQLLADKCVELNIVEKTSDETVRNGSEKGVIWQFTTKDARIKLKRLYPQF